MSGWTLHPQLAADTVAVASLPLSEVRLMDDSNYPWLLLVPRVESAVEWIDLDEAGRHRLLDEIAHASQALRSLYAPDKLNVAALGNIVAQLHVHVVARFRDDAAWPRPVWGVAPAGPYAAGEREALVARLREALGVD